MPTQTSHCHGPHGSDCHSDSGESTHHEENSAERKEHEVVKQDVQFSQVKTIPHVIAPQVIIAILPQIQSVLCSSEASLQLPLQVDFGDSPPSGVTVARTVVLLV